MNFLEFIIFILIMIYAFSTQHDIAILRLRIKELEREINKCPHGFEEWNDCPDCGH